MPKIYGNAQVRDPDGAYETPILSLQQSPVPCKPPITPTMGGVDEEKVIVTYFRKLTPVDWLYGTRLAKAELFDRFLDTL